MLMNDNNLDSFLLQKWAQAPFFLPLHVFLRQSQTGLRLGRGRFVTALLQNTLGQTAP